ncbi:unknown protein [Parachlamydia acanthamoebae UV-7]|uniref:Uncharacterized protein n=2 Tax=Parachlamydia acanthamoebae TaxID=83552 RepID=F8L017_PARAV|nr:hypothetical protein DB43_FU00070 [Parachlamydia acanthamoebae]CCB86531.1 unknown protein [Parachlamydia acanthamoebae UV-7]
MIHKFKRQFQQVILFKLSTFKCAIRTRIGKTEMSGHQKFIYSTSNQNAGAS